MVCRTENRGVWRFALLLSLLGIACADKEALVKRSYGAAPGDAVEIQAQKMTYGFSRGRARVDMSVPDFKISKTPISVGEYRDCVSSGACSVPSNASLVCSAPATDELNGKTYTESRSSDALPVTCTTFEQAKQYCAWKGGNLPTIQEWLIAARGPQVHPHPWGDSEGSCRHHPALTACEEGGATFAVGKHPDGASPLGMQDVLLMPRELLRGEQNSPAPGCSSNGLPCLVASASAGMIDSALGADPGDGSAAPLEQVTGFRCVWESMP